MANIQLNVGTGGSFVATNSLTRDTVTEHMELINVADPSSGACAPVDATNGVAVQVKTSVLPTNAAQDGTDATGVTQLTGGVGIRGWLSGIFSKLSGNLSVILQTGSNVIGAVTQSGTWNISSITNALPAGTNNIGTVTQAPCSYSTAITSTTTWTHAANALVGVQNLSGSAQTISISIYDGTTSAGTLLSGPLTLGAEQIITFPLGGIKCTSGNVAAVASGTPGGSGIQVLYI